VGLTGLDYTVHVKSSAKKEIAALPTDVQHRVAERIDKLQFDPRPPGCSKLAGAEDTYRIRVGDYRIIYDVHDKIVTVTIISVGHRREVYRK